MNKNLNKSAYSLFARSKYDYAQEVQNLRCAFLCALSTRARTFILTLVLALTMVATSAFQIGNFAFAEDTETVITGTVNGKATKIAVVNGATTRVATTEQFKLALSRGISNIIVDPQAAELLTDNLDENNGKGAVTYDGTFYIPIDEPLDISHDINISSDVPVVFARTSGFNRNPGKPAMFNVDSNGNLTLNGDITMTGEVVEATFDEGQGYVESVTVPVVLTDDLDGLYIADHRNSSLMLSPVSTGRHYYIKDGYLVTEDDLGNIKYVQGGSSNLSLRNNPGTLTIRIHDSEGSLATKMVPGESYALWDPSGGGRYLIKGENTDYYAGTTYTYFGFTDDIDKAMKFTASDDSTPSQPGEGTTTPGQDYIAPSLTFDVSEKVWEKSEIAEGGYFIHSDKAGREVTINEGVTLTDLVTAADVKNVAPVVIAGGSKFVMTGGVISGNTVGYGATEADSNGKSIQYIQNKLENTDMTNTAGGVILKGSNTVGEFTSGEISGNKADAGAVIVTDGALVTMEEGFVINDNIGYHHAGAAQVERGGRFIMNGGLMDGNVAWYKGGAVWATQWGTNGYADIDWSKWPSQFPELKNSKKQGKDGVFVMNGGTLSNNTAFARGGAIEVESNGVVLNNGTIEDNKCRSLGGAIYVEGDAQSYSYTLKINNGYIGDNRSVTHEKGSENSPEQYKVDNYTLNRYLKDGELTGDGNDSWDNSFNGAMGNGGGVWLCPVGGSSVFADDKVLIDNNTAKRTGTDFYLHKGNGAMIVQNIAGTWVDERTNPATSVNFDQENGSVLNGPVALRNDQNPEYTEGQSAITDPETDETKNVVIKNNISRDGGGIAANGTLVFGSTNDVDRYDARINITKEWLGITPTKVKFEIGYLDSDGKFVQLKDGTVEGQPANYEFELDGNADTPTGTNGESPAYGGSAVGEVQKESETKWKASAFIPASATLSDGTIYPLYEFVNPYSDGPRTLSPANQSHLPIIRRIIRDEDQSLVIAADTWKLKIREIDANFNVTIRDIEIDNSKTQAPSTPVPMYDPVTGKDTGSGFTVYFSTVELNQTIINEGKGIEFTKLASNTNQALEGTEFYITEAEKGTYWYVPGTRPGNPDNGTLEGSVISEKALNKEPLKPNASGKVEILNSKLKAGKSLTVPGNYLLFETKTAEGYKRKTSPWLVQIDNLGHVTIKEVAADYQGKSIGRGSTPQDFSGTAVEGYDTESVYSTWWDDAWFTENTNGKLMNDVEVKLNKVGPGGEAFNGTATFELYEVQTNKDADGKKTYCYTDSYKVAEVDTNNGVLDLTPYMKDANNDAAYNPYPFTDDKYFILKEKTTSNSRYAVQSAPWLVIVKTNATVELQVYEDINATPIVKGPYEHNDTWYHWEMSKFKTNSLTQAGKLENNYKTFKLTKTNENGSTPLGGAKFALYDVGYHTDGYLYSTKNDYVTKDGKQYTVTSDSETGIIDLTEGIELAISQNKGKDFSLSNAAVSEYTSGKRVLMLYEITRPEGYKRAKAPWLLFIDDLTRDVTVREYDNRYADYKIFENDDNKYWQASKYVEKVVTDGKLRNKPVDLEITKVGLLSDGTKTPLEGVKFNIYHAEEKPIYKPNGKVDHYEYHIDANRPNKINSEYIVSDGAGKFTLPITESGIYLLYEVDPVSGYHKPVAPWGIILNADGELETYKIDDSSDSVLERYVKSYNEATGDKLIHLNCNDVVKVDDNVIENNPQLIKLDRKTDQPLEGAKFDLYPVKLKPDYYGTNRYYVSGKKLNNTYIESDQNGRIDLSDTDIVTPSGSFTYFFLFEKVAPTGYEDTRPTMPWLLIRDNKTWKFTVREITTGYSNYYTEGETYYNRILSGSDGLCEGWFKTTKEEYVYNSTNKIILHKKDSISMEGLKGVKFDIYRGYVSEDKITIDKRYETDGKIASSVKTGDNGAIVLTNLSSLQGTGQIVSLLFVETEAKEGYVKPKAPFLVQLKYENKEYKLIGVYNCTAPEKYGNKPNGPWARTDFTESNTVGDIYNSKAYDLPSAGGMGTYWFMIIGAMMMGFALTAGFTKMDLLKLLRR